ncbi:hypothetical protein FX985_00641 [Pseudomonas extremaustralis]|uniref:Uncharacterized protein n=1 Tax=Pseudomonas extremaustralis TaxID=359110 RepID=A0A5M9IVJ2_9PSED|nr:hypothetical protein [Pseudomonas extremaustralis]KAA8560591.1 hypothetical protein FX985_00641 [Pseudomonas extremaustralis]
MTWLNGAVDESEILTRQQEVEFTSEMPQPGFWQGSLDVIGPGLKRGGIEAANTLAAGLVDLAGTEVVSSLATGLGAGYTPGFDAERHAADAAKGSEELTTEIGRDTAESVKDLRPNAVEVGMAGQIIGELSAVLPRTIAGAVTGGLPGAAVAAGAPAGYAKTQTAMAEGIDPGTARLLGAAEGLTTGVSAVLPAARFVGPVLGDAAIAVGANVGLGIAHRGASAEILREGGYHAQAAQYDMLDKSALATDLVMGLAFFGLARATFRRPTTEQVDAALTDRNAQHADIDTAPGLPVDPRSAVAHQDALRSAIESINRGEPVVLPDNIQSAQFLRTAEESSVVAPSRDVAMATARQDLEPKLRVELEQEAAGILPNVRDVKTELSSVARSLEGLDDTFRARAKEFQQQGQTRKQAEQSARKAIDAERLDLTDRQTSLNEALGGNRSAEQARADLNAMDRGEVPQRFNDRVTQRADAIIQGFQRNPLAEGIAATRRTETPRQLNERVAREELDTLVGEHEATLPREPEAAPVSRAESPPGGRSAEPSAATRGRTEPNVVNDAGKPAGDANLASAEPAELQILRDVISRNPDTMVNSGFDADGKPLQAKAADVLAAIEVEHKAGVREAQSFMAAVNCLLRG